ncbi:MAG: hypothetical protein K8F52_12970 [Candidatus Scalindua rubra]|nr:hypothetical protein [Candidatus Scalindua rubra]TWU28856.1 hypothetical protein S225a_27500 [Candidatus Brocadiaceae bacterium S225]
MTGHKQILAEISITRNAFKELDDFFLKADENIANDPDDPQEGIGHLPGLDRLMFLIPCIIYRLEEDLSKSKEVEDVAPITEGLQTIKEGINSVLTYYLQDDVEGALGLLSNALSSMDKLSGIIPQSSIRFLRDLSVIAPDFHILSSMLEGFRESGRIRPKEPETDKSWSPELWLDYYREQARLEEPLIAMVDAEGLTGTSLEKGMKQMIEEREQMDKRMEKQINSYNLMRNRDAVFDTEYPEKFLDLLEIPDVIDEDDEEYEVRTVDLHYEEEEPEPWASSLPELQDWNKHAFESSFDDSELSHQDFENDLVYLLLKPFTNNIFERLKRDYLNRAKECKNEEDLMRSPLEHYLVILALKPQVRISSCGVMTESIGHDAPRKGVYMFAMECLERIADAIERFSLKHLYPLAVEARNIRKQIEEILTVS